MRSDPSCRSDRVFLFSFIPLLTNFLVFRYLKIVLSTNIIPQRHRLCINTSFIKVMFYIEKNQKIQIKSPNYIFRLTSSRRRYVDYFYMHWKTIHFHSDVSYVKDLSDPLFEPSFGTFFLEFIKITSWL